MTRKHQSPEYQRNARTIRARVKVQHKHGQAVQCWSCGRAITPGMGYDVGHLDRNAPPTLANLLPEHRHCNRSRGGREGADIVNARRQSGVTTWKL